MWLLLRARLRSLHLKDLWAIPKWIGVQCGLSIQNMHFIWLRLHYNCNLLQLLEPSITVEDSLSYSWEKSPICAVSTFLSLFPFPFCWLPKQLLIFAPPRRLPPPPSCSAIPTFLFPLVKGFPLSPPIHPTMPSSPIMTLPQSIPSFDIPCWCHFGKAKRECNASQWVTALANDVNTASVATGKCWHQGICSLQSTQRSTLEKVEKIYSIWQTLTAGLYSVFYFFKNKLLCQSLRVKYSKSYIKV